MKRLSDQVCVGGNHFITLFFAFEGGGEEQKPGNMWRQHIKF